ncbi:flavoprotein [Siphonobacter sp. BAB-5405]|nr:flavoprotein [Siphonobacter sp. BAB-5405]
MFCTMEKPYQILAISGSLRAASTNTQILEKISHWVPDTVSWQIYEELAQIPPFDPDYTEYPAAVEQFRTQLLAADALVFCSPEYVFGVPGVLKNLLDWTSAFSSGEWHEKPTAVITASILGEKAHESLRLTLGILGARILENTSLLISHARTKMDKPETEADLKSVLNALLQELTEKPVLQ